MPVALETTAVLPPLHPGEVLREEFMHPLGLTASAIGAEVARIRPLEREAA